MASKLLLPLPSLPWLLCVFACSCPLVCLQLLAFEGGLPEPATKSDGMSTSVVVVRDGVLVSDTGVSTGAAATTSPLPRTALLSYSSSSSAQAAKRIMEEGVEAVEGAATVWCVLM